MDKSKQIESLINSKSTKADIREAFEKAMDAIREMEMETCNFDPVQVSKEYKNDKVIEASEQVMKSASPEFDLKKYLDEILEKFEQSQLEADLNLTKASEEYLKLKEGIQVKKQEIKDIFQIEIELTDLSKLLQLYSEKELDLNKEFKLFESSILEKEENLKNSYDNLHKSLKIKYSRDLEETQYNHQREKLKLENELADIREKEEKEIERQKVELNELKAKWSADFTELENFKNKVETIPDQLEKAKNEGYNEGQEQAKKSCTFEVNLLKKDYDGKIALLESQVNTLTDITDRLTTEKSELTKKLETAYTEIKDLASNWNRQYELEKYINNLEGVTTNLSNQKDKK